MGTKYQLDSLKDLYLDSLLESMTEVDLKKLAREVLDLQVNGTVGNDEEREVWNEMKEHFGKDFEENIKEVINVKLEEKIELSPEEQEFKKRLDVLEKRKEEQNQKDIDMW